MKNQFVKSERWLFRNHEKRGQQVLKYVFYRLQKQFTKKMGAFLTFLQKEFRFGQPQNVCTISVLFAPKQKRFCNRKLHSIYQTPASFTIQAKTFSSALSMYLFKQCKRNGKNLYFSKKKQSMFQFQRFILTDLDRWYSYSRSKIGSNHKRVASLLYRMFEHADERFHEQWKTTFLFIGKILEQN